MGSPLISAIPARGGVTGAAPGPNQLITGLAPPEDQAQGQGQTPQQERLHGFLQAARRWITEFDDFARALPETAEVLRDMREKVFEAMARAGAVNREAEDTVAGTPKVIGT